VAGIEPRKFRQIIYLAESSSQRDIVSQAVEVTCVECISQLRQRGRATTRSQVDHARQCVCAVEDAVGPAQHLKFFYSGGGQSAKVHQTTNIVHGNSIEQDFVGIAVAAAQEKRSAVSMLAVLDNLDPGNAPQRLENVELVLEFIAGDH